MRVSFSSSPRWVARGSSLLTRERPIVYRFDSQRPRRYIWFMRDRGARLSGARRVAWFLEGLLTAEQLVFRTRDVEGRRLDLSFRIAGAPRAVPGLLDTCGDTEIKPRLFDPA